MKIYYALIGGVIDQRSPSRMGAWGFDSREKLLEERRVVEKELREVIKDLLNEGYELEVYGGDVFDNEAQVFARYDFIRGSDALMIFAVGPETNVMRALLSLGKPSIVFVKSKDPYYTFAEIFNARIIRMETDKTLLYDPHDVFVVYDDYNEVKKILRALYGVYMLRRSRVLYIGVPYGWQGRFNELRAVLKKIGLEIIFLDHDRAYEEAMEYVESEDGRKEVEIIMSRLLRESVDNKLSIEGLEAGVRLYVGLRYLAKKYNANIVTISGCMMYGASRWRSTPCLAFSLLDDEGLLGVCEGDMTNLVAKTLLRYISNKPAVFVNPSIPVKGREAVYAHCTSPTKLLGYRSEGFKYVLTTHFESDSPAAIKVLYEPGHKITLLNLSFDLESAVIGLAESSGYTDYPICRSQIKVMFNEDVSRLNEYIRGFHWSYVYGEYVEELIYAMKLLKINYVVIR